MAKAREKTAPKGVIKVPAPKPGSDRAVKQHQALAQGYTLPESDRCVDLRTSQTSTTGKTHVPGLTGRK